MSSRLLIAGLIVLTSACANTAPRAPICPSTTGAIQAELRNLAQPRFFEGPLIPAEAVRTDLQTWLARVEALHAAPERFDRQGLAQAIDDVRRGIDAPMDQRRAWLVLARLNPFFHDGHTGVLFPNRIERAQSHLDSGGRLFPLDLRIENDRLVTLSEPKREIISINGVKAGDLIADMLAITEGDTLAFRRELVGRRFALLHWLLLGDTGDYVVELRNAGGCATVEVMNGAGAIPARALRDPPASSQFSYSVLPGGIGYLRASSFDGGFAGHMASFAREAFSAFKAARVRALIIDVRDNGGGDDELWMSNLMDHVTAAPYRHVSSYAIRVTAENADPGDVVGSLSRGEYQRRRTPPANDPLRFEGPVYVMISGFTYSSAIVFAATMQDAQAATIAGAETGGYACQTGRVTPIQMANTGLTAFAPILSLTRPSGVGCESGIKPDIPLQQTYGDAGFEELAAHIREGLDGH